MGFGQNGIHIKIVDIAAVDLIERDLKLTADVIVVKTEVILFLEEHVLILCQVILNWDWARRPCC
jgi:hypothetical protein